MILVRVFVQGIIFEEQLKGKTKGQPPFGVPHLGIPLLSISQWVIALPELRPSRPGKMPVPPATQSRLGETKGSLFF